jgi:hypothetical protein
MTLIRIARRSDDVGGVGERSVWLKEEEAAPYRVNVRRGNTNPGWIATTACRQITILGPHCVFLSPVAVAHGTSRDWDLPALFRESSTTLPSASFHLSYC